MRRIEYLDAARRDLRELFAYISDRNPSAAERMLDRLERAIELVGLVPGVGHLRKDVANPSYRFHIVRPYVIAYRFDDVSLTVVRVLHGRRDIATELRND